MPTTSHPSVAQIPTSKAPPYSVLFVCLGNICRSPMCEAVLRHLTSAYPNPGISAIDSAGTGAYHTHDPPDYRTIATLRAHDIPNYWGGTSKHTKSSGLPMLSKGARQVRLEDFEEFDYILAMDVYNLRDLKRLQKRAEAKSAARGERVEASRASRAKVMLFGEFSGSERVEEVGDPYYGVDDGFEEVYQQVTRFSENFLKHLEERRAESRVEANGDHV